MVRRIVIWAIEAVLAVLFGITLILVVVEYGPWGAGNRPSLEKVKVGQVGDIFLYMSLYYAKDKGFFENEGLEVSFVTTNGDEKSVAAVISGDVLFGVGDPTFSPIAGQRGAKTKIVASVLNGVPFWGVTFKTDIPTITDSKQLAGYTVATFPSPSTAYTLQSQMFRDGGLEPKIREAQFGTLLPTLKSGSADIALEIEPNVSIAVKEGGKVLFGLARRFGDFAITGVSVSEDTITKRRPLVERFVRALDAAEKAAHADPKAVEDFAVKRFPDLDPMVARSAIRRMLADGVFPASARISADAWRKALQLRIESGELKSEQVGMPYLDMTLLRDR